MGMFLFILSLIALVAVVPILLVSWDKPAYEMDRFGRRVQTGTSTRTHLPRGLAVVAFCLALLFFLLGSITIVQAKNVGVLTTFGKVSERTLSSGLHLKLPWQKVTEIDGTWQFDEYKGDDCIYVRIGDGSRSCVTLANRWRVNGAEANTVYTDYRSDDPTDNLRSVVVSSQLKSAVQEVMGKYNPVAALKPVEGTEVVQADINFAPDYDQVARDIYNSMQRRLGDEPLVEIKSITVSYVSLAETTQKKIDDFNAEIARTRIAAQQVKTNEEVAKANKTLADSISNDPNVLVSRCLDLAEAGKDIGLSCWPLGNASVLAKAN